MRNVLASSSQLEMLLIELNNQKKFDVAYDSFAREIKDWKKGWKYSKEENSLTYIGRKKKTRKNIPIILNGKYITRVIDTYKWCDIEKIDTSKIIEMKGLFSNSDIKELDLSFINTLR